MRMKRAIDALKSDGVRFPEKTHETFDHYLITLRAIVAENFGYSAGRTLEWDQYSETFGWAVDSELVCKVSSRRDGGDEARVLFKRSYHIDPKKPLTDEIARVERERAEFLEQRIEIARAIHTYVGGAESPWKVE